jgi:hypothetical protein
MNELVIMLNLQIINILDPIHIIPKYHGYDHQQPTDTSPLVSSQHKEEEVVWCSSATLEITNLDNNTKDKLGETC